MATNYKSEIECDCGNKIEKDYLNKTINVGQGNELFRDFICGDCGQVFRENLKVGIILKPVMK